MSLLCHFAGCGTASTTRAIAAGAKTEPGHPPRPVPNRLPSRDDDAVQRRSVVAKRMGHALLATPLTHRELARLEADVDEMVDVWTPGCHLRSRFELTSFLLAGDDAIGELEVDVVETVVTGHTVLLEWVATGRVTGPAFLDDDELIEPTGAVVRVGGVLCVHFGGGERATRVACYYDRLGLIEQMLDAPSAPGSP